MFIVLKAKYEFNLYLFLQNFLTLKAILHGQYWKQCVVWSIKPLLPPCNLHEAMLVSKWALVLTFVEEYSGEIRPRTIIISHFEYTNILFTAVHVICVEIATNFLWTIYNLQK